MQILLLALLGLMPFGVIAQEVFEPADFNVKEALLKNGVDVADLPELSQLGKRSSMSRCEVACNSLQKIFDNDKVAIREDSSYEAFASPFWSAQQQATTPQCIFKPETAVDVSTLVLLSRLTQCPFAVRSGGHAAFASASNIQGGITVNFEKMKDITLSEDKKVAAIQPGNRWGEIYSNLESHNLAVVGGRISDVGIGGLTTGGGISFFANQYGWTCDNVDSYEVVTASGQIVTVSPTSFPDLYFALRGGGNSFAIVTKFNLETFSHGPLMFGGHLHYDNTSFPALFDALVKLGESSADDTKATQMISLVFNATTGTQMAIAELEYADPVAEPAFFEPYRQIPAIYDTTKLDTLANITQVLNSQNPNGYRESYWTASAKLDRGIVQFVYDVSKEEFAKITDVQGIVPATTLQIITVPQMEQMQKKGGNALGLDSSDGPILNILLTLMWVNSKDDARVWQACANILKRIEEEAKSRDLANEYLYMNYASQFQDVIRGYGASKEILKIVADKYDPTQVFQKLQPGYFKLDGPPAVLP
ncbi:hypothetical protein HBI70_237070 [Parastagonospora nodorum]|nr:hypothetical protein HBH51_228600 [Parastagonospora nodorum]KAH3991738.1 hypothetical protein HBI10_227830 [Parastagonospora nodorum]KAH4008818.1 hypothetical protein HBI13_230070 [Parastagonospora nodorum]KAH4012093.1 hypothetical protein HBI09_223960 [Parastagonospora nodorum]KAH4152421.1 hypothetical protein HBH43_233300 [Parastagonospora nodorum]